MTPELKVTSALLWRATLIFALVDAAFVPLLAWRIKPERLRQLKWPLAATIVIAGFEFMFYWCIMLSIASLMQRGWEWSKGVRYGRA